MAKKTKYYVVWKGRKPGVYTQWPEAQAQVAGFEGALFKSYPHYEEAQKAFEKGASAFRANSSGGSSKKSKGSIPRSKIIWKSLSVDAACSGNPGPMEYQGVDTQSKEQIFHHIFEMGTNNIGEFLGIVHGLALLQKQNLAQMPIYTDSATAMAWVRNKKVKTNLERNEQTKKLFDLIERGENWLKVNQFSNPILKWETKSWGEIPADFGRK